MKIIVLGGHVQALGILRILGKAGHEVYIADRTKKNIARHSKYCSGFLFNQNASWETFLLELNSNMDGAVIFPTNDEQVKVLSLNKQSLRSKFKLAVSDWDIAEKCYFKNITYEIAKRIGLNIPFTYYPKNNNEVDKIGREIKYPVIIKPSVMHVFYKHFKKKVFLCKNFDDLVYYYQKVANVIGINETMIQEVILGDSSNNYSVGALCKNGDPIVTVIARRKRQHPLDFGNATTFAETVDIPQLKQDAYKILKEINYTGICEVEFKYDKLSNSYKLLEINPRTWKWHYISVISNSPFLIQYLEMLNENNVVVKNDWEEASWRHLITDIPVFIKTIFIKKCIKKTSKPLIEAVWSLNDFKPMIMELLYLPFLIKSR